MSTQDFVAALGEAISDALLTWQNGLETMAPCRPSGSFLLRDEMGFLLGMNIPIISQSNFS